jgi:hypothetical protein
MTTAIVGVAVLALLVAFVVAVARDPGPPPDDVAVAYEEAWDRLDFDALWTLSGDELRDGLHRKDYIAAKRDAYRDQAGLGGLSAAVTVERFEAGTDVAVVETRVALHDGSAAHNEVQLTQRAGRWVVVAYRLLRSDPSTAPS